MSHTPTSTPAASPPPRPDDGTTRGKAGGTEMDGLARGQRIARPCRRRGLSQAIAVIAVASQDRPPASVHPVGLIQHRGSAKQLSAILSISFRPAGCAPAAGSLPSSRRPPAAWYR